MNSFSAVIKPGRFTTARQVYTFVRRTYSNGMGIQDLPDPDMYNFIDDGIRKMSGVHKLNNQRISRSEYGAIPLVLEACDGLRSTTFREAFVQVQPTSVETVIHPAEFFGRTWKRMRQRNISSTRSPQAMKCLEDFLELREFHADAIIRVLSRDPLETEVRDVLAEHLFSKLVPEHRFLVNASSKTANTCPCGCPGISYRRIFSIGHKSVWHGDPDILVIEPKVSVLTLGPCEPADDVDDDTEEEDIEDENKLSLQDQDFSFKFLKKLEQSYRLKQKQREVDETERRRYDLSDIAVFQQVVAMSIVNSFVATSEHNLINRLVPSIASNGERIAVYFYDCQNDILMRTFSDLPLFRSGFVSGQKDDFNMSTILYLWMCLNYIQFGPYLSPSRISALKEDGKCCHFHDLVNNKLKIYQEKSALSMKRIQGTENLEPDEFNYFLDLSYQDEFQISEEEFSKLTKCESDSGD